MTGYILFITSAYCLFKYACFSTPAPSIPLPHYSSNHMGFEHIFLQESTADKENSSQNWLRQF